MAEEGISFRQCANAFLRCSDPKRLQQLADSLLPYDLITCGQKWLTYLVPFFTAKERSRTGCQRRLFLSQVEYSDNLVFRRRAALDALAERLLDANRTIGQPDKISVIFGRRITKLTFANSVSASRPKICPRLTKPYARSRRDIWMFNRISSKPSSAAGNSLASASPP
jgi:hypothetical protein